MDLNKRECFRWRIRGNGMLLLVQFCFDVGQRRSESVDLGVYGLLGDTVVGGRPSPAVKYDSTTEGQPVSNAGAIKR